MNEKAENKVVEIVKFPKTKEQDMSLIFYFESPREDVAQVMLEHQAKWIIEELKKYPMPEREILYNKIIADIRERDKQVMTNE